MTFKVWYFHGLNTYGDDDLHLGPVRMAPMHQHLALGLRQRGIAMIPVLGLGRPPLRLQTHRALHFLHSHPDFSPSHTHHFLGHSIGGIIARAVARDLPPHPRLATITTIATPHAGTRSAHIARDLLEARPWLVWLFEKLGYSLHDRLDVFREFAPEEMRLFNESTPHRPDVQYESITCSKPRNQWSWPIQLLNALAKVDDSGEPMPSDGLIEESAQFSGERLGHFQLDHLEEIGYCWGLRATGRLRARAEFERLLDCLAGFWQNHQIRTETHS